MDTQISLSSDNDHSLVTNVHRKPTDTKAIINFQSVCRWIWKSDLIKYFLNRAFIVCTNGLYFMKKFQKLKDIFHMNGYPKEILCSHVKKFLSEKLMTTNSCQNMNDEKKYTVIIPFIGHPSIAFKKSLTKNLEGINKECSTIFNTFRVQNYFSLKDETQLALQANVIYLFEGSCDKNQTYIGKTKSTFGNKEHFSGNSAIFEHMQQQSIFYIFCIQTNNNDNIHTYVSMNTEWAGIEVMLLI